MSDSAFPVPECSLETELVVRGSRFIARVHPVETRDEAMSQITRARSDHPDATHHCWAYVLGKPGAATSAAMNDDGEPSGTAGRPILSVIEHKSIGNVLIIVSRYFGGRKLGAGGLVRAYAGAAEAVLSKVQTVEQVPRTTVDLCLDFSMEQPLRHWVNGHDAQIARVDYGENVRIRLQLPVDDLESLHSFAAARGVRVQANSRRHNSQGGS